MELTKHPDTFKQASTSCPAGQKYQFTYPLSLFINPHHAFLDLSPENALVLLTAPGIMEHANGKVIEGWLWKGDAMKLYELAYFAEGDVLELGTFAGLSTCIIARAIADSGRDSKIFSVDLVDSNWRASAEPNQLTNYIDFQARPAEEVITEYASRGRNFPFIFVDHSHSYEDVSFICTLLDQVTKPGGFVQFHDYSDPRNGVEPDYGVFQAVTDKLPASFEFYGVYGCSGLYRYNPNGGQAGAES